MKKLVTMPASAFALSLVVASLGFAAGATRTISVSAKLNAKQEVPKQVVKDTKAKGLFTGKLVAPMTNTLLAPSACGASTAACRSGPKS